MHIIYTWCAMCIREDLGFAAQKSVNFPSAFFVFFVIIIIVDSSPLPAIFPFFFFFLQSAQGRGRRHVELRAPGKCTIQGMELRPPFLLPLFLWLVLHLIVPAKLSVFSCYALGSTPAVPLPSPSSRIVFFFSSCWLRGVFIS